MSMQINVPALPNANFNTTLSELSSLMDTQPTQVLAYTPWPKQYPYKPNVRFAIAYGSDCLFLKYYVEEKDIVAANGQPNTPVYKDACVEFFISLDDAQGYYNFEINCIGTVLAGFGKGKPKRELLPIQFVRQIRTQSIITRNTANNNVAWEITVAIPFISFCYSQPTPLKGKIAKANFYKCGDLLPQSHYVSWSNIEAPDPNFHLPNFFGELHFV
jgi:hypothetical protein